MSGIEHDQCLATIHRNANTGACSVVDPDPYSEAFGIRIRIRTTDPDPLM